MLKPMTCKKLLLMLVLFSAKLMYAQTSILPNAYAHNDYWHKRPLFDALDNGFSFVEADVYLRNNKLIVAHILPCFKKKRTLEDLYLKPLLNYMSSDNKNLFKLKNCPVTLMIDIKSNATKTYNALILLLDKYKSILSEYNNGSIITRNVTIVITGHKSYQLIKASNSRLVFLDEDLKQASADSSCNLYQIASCKYSSLLQWKGKGYITEDEIQRLEYFVSEAHKNGRKVRLWGSPENKAVWSQLLKCNVDLINTNKLVRLKKFLLADMLMLANKTEKKPANTALPKALIIN
jgi:Glycerophosphoryl diester phosphodiesterase family